MTDSHTLIGVFILIITFPFIVYLSVKLGTYAFYKGRKLFYDEFGEEDE